MNVFLERIMDFAQNQGFKTISDFARRGLGWNSSEKLNRLKVEKNKPGIDIYLEISNKFDNADLHYLLTGKFCASRVDENVATETEVQYRSELVETQAAMIALQREVIDDLRKRLQD